MPTKKRQSKRSQIIAARREYNQLTRTYRAIGKKVLGKPKRSQIRQDYSLIKRERDRAGRRLGKLTGVHKGR